MKHLAGSIDELVAPFGPRVQALVEHARRVVKRTVPTAKEGLRAGWGLIGYSAPRYFAFLLPVPDGVRLGFEWGVRLRDPRRLLRGDGRQVRFVDVRTRQQLDSPGVRALLLESAALARDPTSLRR